MMYKYTTKIKQPQSAGDVKIDPAGGVFTERQYKTVKKDAYGASLLEKGLLVVETPAGLSASSGDSIPDFDGGNAPGAGIKRNK
jgi:hypothetical protein